MSSALNRNPVRIAIVGGGIAGLSAAWQARQDFGAAAEIHVLEAADRLGGKLHTVDFATGPVDMGAEAFLGLRQHFVDFVHELGMSEELRTPATDKPSALWVGDRLVDIPKRTFMGIPASGGDVQAVVGEKVASLIDAEITTPPVEWTPGQDISVGELVESRFGRDVVDLLVTPMLSGVYSTDAHGLGVRATMPQLAEELDERGAKSGHFHLSEVISAMLNKREESSQTQNKNTPRPPVFRSFTQGYGSLVEALVARSGAELHLTTVVAGITREAHTWQVDPLGEVDALILAVPAPIAAGILGGSAPRIAEALRNIELASSVVVGMRFASDEGIPERSGVLIGTQASTDAKAFTFSSKKWPHLAERGGALLRASFGTAGDTSYLQAEDSTLVELALRDLQRITGRELYPEETYVQRWWGGIPRYGVGHRETVHEVETAVLGVPGLGVAGAMLNGVGVPAAAATGRAAVRKIRADLTLMPPR